MLVFENIKLAFRSLQANKMRALLTMLGIIIGIGSVIAIMTVSSSLTTSISDSFQEMGANNITVGLKEKSDSANISISGINKDYFKSKQITLLAGRHIKSSDISKEKKVIMVSDKVVELIFEGKTKEALGKKISVSINDMYYDFYIVGVYKYEETTVDSSTEEDITTTAYIPITTGKEQTHAEDGYSQFTVVTSTNVASVSDFASQIEAFY